MKDKQEFILGPKMREKAYRKKGWKYEGLCHLPVLGECCNACSREKRRPVRWRGMAREALSHRESLKRSKQGNDTNPFTFQNDHHGCKGRAGPEGEVGEERTGEIIWKEK